MFHIGDQIVHPLHGAGVIEDIVERTIDGTPAQYYALRPAFGDTQLFIPVDSCERLGIRPVCSRAQAEAFLHKLDDVARSEDKGWNQRYRENMLHIRSGDLLEVAQVVKNLAERDRERGLSTGEKKMLASAKQILASELAFSLGISPEEAGNLIRQRLCI
ncbi:MAG: CarD family transcriptional regulator [Clostridiaceae bacterium]|nr:CarD family transcriptional regulator [Clostridiaceae bacterium]